MNKIFKIEKNLTHKIITFLGIKIKIRFKVAEQFATLDDLRVYTLASKINANLAKYRGIFTGRDILIVGGGASLKYFDKLPKNTINIGINRAYKMKNIKFDYLFAQDNFPDKEDIEEFIKYGEDTCVKMLGIHPYLANFSIKNDTICRIKNKELYVLNNRRPNKSLLPINISIEPLARFDGTVFAVLQFCLFANAKKIYLAGFDCNVSHMFTSDVIAMDLTRQYEYWIQMKTYMDCIYNSCDIVSINPIGLKGLFKDVYTQSYVNAHPELMKEEIEII